MAILYWLPLIFGLISVGVAVYFVLSFFRTREWYAKNNPLFAAAFQSINLATILFISLVLVPCTLKLNLLRVIWP